jgi:hypothetical protein
MFFVSVSDVNVITTVPLVIIGLIKEYLTAPIVESFYISLKTRRKNFRSWRSFCNCCKTFSEIKRLFCFYDLNSLYSMIYLSLDEENISSVSFSIMEVDLLKMRVDVKKLLSCIHDSRSQITLLLNQKVFENNKGITEQLLMKYSGQLDKVYGVESNSSSFFLSHQMTAFNSLSYLSLFSSYITNLFPLNNAKAVCLDCCCFGVKDYSRLSHCQEVNLTGAVDLVNLVSLAKVKKLTLSRTKVSDVSCLVDVYYLDLSHCFFINDVTMLGKCHTLLLQDCRNISDISTLGNVTTLDIRGLTNLKQGLPYDNKVKNLLFSSFYSSEVTKFINKEKRRLFTVEVERETVLVLEGFRRLKLLTYSCMITHLRSLQQLTIDHYTFSDDNCCLSDLPSLTHFYYEGYFFNNIKIDNNTIPNLINITLTIKNDASQVIDILSTVQHFVFKDCHNIKDIILNLNASLTSFKIIDCASLPKVCRNGHMIQYFDCDKNVSLSSLLC